MFCYVHLCLCACLCCACLSAAVETVEAGHHGHSSPLKARALTVTYDDGDDGDDGGDDGDDGGDDGDDGGDDGEH